MTNFKRISAMAIAVTMMVSVLSAGASDAKLNGSVKNTISIFSDIEKNQSFASSIFNEISEVSEESIIQYPNDNEISPMWLSSGHKGIVDYNIGDLPDYHIRILRGASNWADDCFSASDNGKDSFVTPIPALHGKGNYVVNLEFLWYFSVFLGRQSNPTSYDDMNNKIKSARSSALEKIKGTTAYQNRNDNGLQNLISNSGTLVKYDANIKQNNNTRTAAEMKMRILGYAAHLLGDVYSHRTMLKSTSGLSMSYFKSSLANDVPKEIVEFRYLTKTSYYLLKESNKSIVNQSYVDNPNFRPNRYNDATVNVSILVTETGGAYDYYLFLCPCSNDVKLSNFKKYVKNSGLNTSKLTSSEWAKYST